MLKRHKGDWPLVEAYLKFCVQVRAANNFERVFLRSVRYFGSDIRFWLVGVYFQFDIVRNPTKARALMLQGLALNKTIPQFWAEYLELELRIQLLFFERKRAVKAAERGEELELEMEVESEVSQVEIKMVESGDEEDISDKNSERALLAAKPDEFASLQRESNQSWEKILETVAAKIRELGAVAVKQVSEQIASAVQKLKTQNPKAAGFLDEAQAALGEALGATHTHHDEASHSDSRGLDGLCRLIRSAHSPQQLLKVEERLNEEVAGSALAKNQAAMRILLHAIAESKVARDHKGVLDFAEGFSEDPELSLLFLQIIATHSGRLLPYFDLQTKHLRDSSCFKGLNKEQKKDLRTKTFAALCQATVSEGSLKEDSLSFLIKKANLDRDLLDVAGTAFISRVLSDSTHTEDERRRLFQPFLGLKNYCPTVVIVGFMAEPHLKPDWTLFNRLLEFKVSDINVWFALMTQLWRSAKVREAEELRLRCLRQFPSQADLIGKMWGGLTINR